MAGEFKACRDCVHCHAPRRVLFFRNWEEAECRHPSVAERWDENSARGWLMPMLRGLDDRPPNPVTGDPGKRVALCQVARATQRPSQIPGGALLPRLETNCGPEARYFERR